MKNFIKFGSKHFSMDELAQEMGISKKTLYKHFAGKDELVTESLQLLLSRMRNNVDGYMERNPNEEKPLTTIIYIYRQALFTLKETNPSFFYGLRKYYPEAFNVFSEFKRDIVWDIVYPLLREAQKLGQVRKSANVELICILFLSRLEDTLYATSNLFDEYNINDLLEHIVINNLRGILTLKYLQTNPLQE